MEELPYGWPGPPGNAAALRLSGLPLSRPPYFSRKRAVAKEIVQSIKAVLGGVEGVHEALLKALDRGEVRGTWSAAVREEREGEGARRERRREEREERERRRSGRQQSSALFLSFSPFFSLSLPRKRPSLYRGDRRGSAKAAEGSKSRVEERA
jgi:hypothetical protein